MSKENARELLKRADNNLIISKKTDGDTREGDYWISVYTRGCGCCSDSEMCLFDKKETLFYLEREIEKKNSEVRKLLELKDEIEQEEKEK